MTTDMKNALQGKTVHPVAIARFDIDTDPVLSWSGPGTFAPSGTGDSALDGFTFTSVDGATSVSDIQEDQSTGKPLIVAYQGHDLDEELLRQVVRDKRAWIGKDAYVWFGLLETESSVVADPTRVKTGVLTKMEIRRDGEQAVVVVTIDVDKRNAGAPAFRILDHPRIWSGDEFSTFMVKLSNKGSRFTDRDVRAGPSRGGFGRSGNLSFRQARGLGLE